MSFAKFLLRKPVLMDLHRYVVRGFGTERKRSYPSGAHTRAWGNAPNRRARRGTSATHLRDYQQTRPTSYTRRRSSPGARAQHPTVRARPLEDSSAARGTQYAKVVHSSSLFRGRTCAARGRVGTALRGQFVASKLALLFCPQDSIRRATVPRGPKDSWQQLQRRPGASGCVSEAFWGL